MIRFSGFCLAVALLLVPQLGCGGHSGGLATDSGEMTIEEYEREQAKLGGGMEAMPENTETPGK